MAGPEEVINGVVGGVVEAAVNVAAGVVGLAIVGAGLATIAEGLDGGDSTAEDE